jgi:hypothetical protein
MVKIRTSKALRKILKESYPIKGSIEDLSNDPVVVAKKEKAVKLIKEFGLPESLKNKTKPKGKRQKA